MITYSLAIAWNWEFDDDFIAGVERECARRGLSTYLIDPSNLAETLKNLRNGAISFRALYDRASDADPEFLPLVRMLEAADAYTINPHEYVIPAMDKAVMHYRLIGSGLEVPFTVILPSFADHPDVSITHDQFARLGKPFVIKPANTTGGGTGVVLNATGLADISAARAELPNDIYLLQEKLSPVMFDGRRGWFRVYNIFGTIIPCWWDDCTHLYSEMAPGDEARYRLEGLRDVITRIGRTCRLDFFSSEIAVVDGHRLVVVDYVNEVCDMRLKSRHGNGVPDSIVHAIERLIAREVDQQLQTAGEPGLSGAGHQSGGTAS